MKFKLLLSIFIVFILIYITLHQFNSFRCCNFGYEYIRRFSTVENITFTFPDIQINLTISFNQIYHHNAIAYDFYSINDIDKTTASDQWHTFPLPNSNSSFNFTQLSPFVQTKLNFVDEIFLITDYRLVERHRNLRKAFQRQGIELNSLKWRMKWNRTTCHSNSSLSIIYQRLNLKNQSLNDEQIKRCGVTMEHIDVWQEIADRKIQLSLILEDDVIFVPFFKEKLTRMMYAAIDQRILNFNKSCVKPKVRRRSEDLWIDQNPMIVIGGCVNLHGESFEKYSTKARPVFSRQKSNPSRCTHGYLLTKCSAEALIYQIHQQKNDFAPSDFMQNYLFRLSSTLQSFWIDPPLVYQGNQVIDLDNISSFKVQTYFSV